MYVYRYNFYLYQTKCKLFVIVINLIICVRKKCALIFGARTQLATKRSHVLKIHSRNRNSCKIIVQI